MINIPTSPSYVLDEQPESDGVLSQSTFEPVSWVDSRAWMMQYPGNQGSVPMCVGEMIDMWLRTRVWKLNGVVLPDNEYDPKAIWEKAHELTGVTDPQAGTTFTAGFDAAKALGYLADSWTLQLWWGDDNYQKALHRSQTGTCWVGLDITEGWSHINESGTIRYGGHYDNRRGGHAVLGGTYNKLIRGVQTAWGPIGWGGVGLVQLSVPWFKNHLLMGASVYDTKTGVLL